MTTRHMRLVSGFVTLGLSISGLVTAGGPGATAAVAAGRTRQVSLCHLPVTRPVLTTGPARTQARTAAPKPVPAAVIRVDQVGYPTSATKLAEIMTTSRRATVRWELIKQSSCRVVAHGTASTDLGAWNVRYPAVWAVTFSGVHQAGTYRLAVAGHPAVASPWFKIANSSRLYRRPLANALSFFQNERDGPDFIRSPLRTAPGHRNDANAMTFRAPPVDDNGNFKGSLAKYATGLRINATGGWFDAR